MRLMRSAVLLAAAAGWAHSQSMTNGAGFEVASIKRNTGGDTKAYVQALPGRLVMQNFSLRRLIVFAYRVQDYQLSGDPSWIDSEHYDIQAKAEGTTSVQQMEGPMLRALLEDRFQVKLHRETRPLPVYELTVAKSGAKLQPTREGSCTPYSVDSPPPPAPADAPRPTFCGYPRLAAEGMNRTLDGLGVSLAALATNLSRSELGRPIVDRTALTGTFDLHLKWTLDAPADAPVGSSLVAALQEQLGLKLESAKGPVEVLVLEHVERPSEN